MRKFLSIVMALVLGFTFASAETVKLYCKVTQSWWTADNAAVGVYAYGANDAKNAAWPGVRMAAVAGEEGVWEADIDKDLYTHVIFTRLNGSGDIADWGAKTGDLEIPADGKNLYTITSTSAVWGDPGVAGEWSVKASGEQGGEQGGGEQEVETRTVYFVNTLDWAAVKAHVWGGENIASTTWPGDAMTKEANKINDKDVYSYTFNAAHNNIVFNNGVEPIIQTVDLELNASSVYFVPGELSGTKYTGAWYATAEAISEGGDVPVVEKKGIFLAGEMNGWNETANPMVVNADSSKASVTVALQAKSYEFKIISDGTYLSLNGEGETKYQFNRNWTATPNAVNLTGGRNFELVADVAGNYTFNWSTADSLLSITFPAAGEEQPTLHYLVGSAASMGAWAPENAVLMQGDSIVLDLAAGEYQFKVLFQQAWGDQLGYSDLNAECSSEGLSQGENDNIVGTLAEAGQLKVKVVGGKLCVIGNFATPEPVQPGVKVLPVVKLAGSLTSWTEAEMPLFVPAADSLSATLKLNLIVDHYQFKIISDGNWMTKFGGEDEFFTVHRGWPKAEHVDQINVNEHNMKLITDMEGEYTFTWVYADSSLYVTYPEIQHFYQIFGDSVNNWDAENLVDMPNNVYELALEAGASCQFQVVRDNWAEQLGYAAVDHGCSSEGVVQGDNANIKVTMAAAGKMKVEVVNGKLCVTGNFATPAQPEKEKFYLVGSMTEWAVVAEPQYTFVENVEVLGEYILSTTLTEGQALKVVGVLGETQTWYPEDYDGAYTVDAAHAGNVVIYFRPDGNEDWAAFGGYIYIAADEQTGIDNTKAEMKAVKFMKDGQLFIMINGQVYTATGAIR